MKYYLLRLPLFILLSHIGIVAADIAVITHPDNTNTLDEDQVRNIFLGKTKVFPNGQRVNVFSLKKGHKSRDEFNRSLLHKSESNLNAYWARMIFSSRAKPPTEVGDEQSLIHTVANDQSSIGYIDADLANNQITVILIIKD